MPKSGILHNNDFKTGPGIRGRLIYCSNVGTLALSPGQLKAKVWKWTIFRHP